LTNLGIYKELSHQTFGVNFYQAIEFVAAAVNGRIRPLNLLVVYSNVLSREQLHLKIIIKLKTENIGVMSHLVLAYERHLMSPILYFLHFLHVIMFNISYLEVSHLPMSVLRMTSLVKLNRAVFAGVNQEVLRTSWMRVDKIANVKYLIFVYY
jgi:hypothetical protein